MGIFKLNGIDYMGGGGGGNANDEELTYAEYLELTEEEKTNGTNYFITDITNLDGDFQPVVYSEDEREIGIWTDGKPLYEKTIVNELTLTSSWQQYTSSSYMDTIVSVNCNYLRDGENTCGAFSTNEIAPWLNRNNYIQVCGTGSATSGWKIISMTIRYTKTTDQPGSGAWTPQGTPAVHYSTEEQIVGTWVDGSTVYEKTLYYASLSAAHNNWVLLDTISIEQLLDVDVSFKDSGGRQLDEQYLRISYYNGSLYYHTPESSGTCTDIYITIQYTKTT